MKEQNSFIQYISVSANHIFKRKCQQKPVYKPVEEVQPYNVIINRSLSNMTMSTLESCSLSDDDDDDEEDDDNDFTPTPSMSSCTLKYANKEEPWRLNPLHFNGDEYFFQDRDEKHQTDDTSNCSISIERDSYGFKRPTQWVKLKHLHQFDTYYQPILDRQQLKWKKMIQNGWPPVDSIKLKRYARQGIPSEFRGEAWLHYSGARSKMEANPELYPALVQTAMQMGENNEYAEIIQRGKYLKIHFEFAWKVLKPLLKDLHRTFPDNLKFACVSQQNSTNTIETESNSKLQSLRRILLAFSLHSPQIGYCQSLNYLAGFFLLFCNTEQEAFWMLVTTVHDYLPENMYDVTMEGANIDQSVLMMLVYEHIPEIWSKISTSSGCFWENHNRKRALPPITLVTNHWFLTMFINILPIETVLRIWDCFFIEGYSIMFQTALTIMKMNSEKIATLEDPIEIFQILQNMPRRLIDCHQFMNNVFSADNSFSNLDAIQIAQRREFVKDQHFT
ncbi:hypothetical protein MBANPS3_003274 [Mucor bainieri]